MPILPVIRQIVNTLTQRIITAVVLLLGLGATLFWLPQNAMRLLLGSFVLVGVWEWSGFFALDRTPVRVMYTMLMFGLGLVPVWFGTLAINLHPLLYSAVVWWLLLLCWLIFMPRIVGKWGCVIAGVICLQSAWVALLELIEVANGPALFVWFLAIVAAADVGAYFTGRRWGKRKLAPLISPGKTWEGLIGGLLLATLTAALGADWFGGPTLVFVFAGPGIAIISVVGDLTVSMFKRYAGLKDSGRLLPGHGGVMDRIDSLVAALPLFVVVLLLTGMLGA